ncbi:MAG: hypothetical protein GF398_21895 [Chitinivibrionales bacterium]|nr:hypothetical protein [Chitinivibrionales bacterium]
MLNLQTGQKVLMIALIAVLVFFKNSSCLSSLSKAGIEHSKAKKMKPFSELADGKKIETAVAPDEIIIDRRQSAVFQPLPLVMVECRAKNPLMGSVIEQFEYNSSAESKSNQAASLMTMLIPPLAKRDPRISAFTAASSAIVMIAGVIMYQVYSSEYSDLSWQRQVLGKWDDANAANEEKIQQIESDMNDIKPLITTSIAIGSAAAFGVVLSFPIKAFGSSKK